MAKLIKCDVVGCGTVDSINGSPLFGGYLPAGWRSLTETRMFKPIARQPIGGLSEAGSKFAGAIAEKLGIPSEIIDGTYTEVPEFPAHPMPVTFDICPLHDMPDLITPPGMPEAAPLHRKH